MVNTMIIYEEHGGKPCPIKINMMTMTECNVADIDIS
jgi:hypothetical protein